MQDHLPKNKKIKNDHKRTRRQSILSSPLDRLEQTAWREVSPNEVVVLGFPPLERNWPKISGKARRAAL